jgi:hypothetical protein
MKSPRLPTRPHMFPRFPDNFRDNFRCREDSLNGLVPCTHSSPGVFGSPWHPTISNLCYDQSFLPSSASIGFHDFAKARVSYLLSEPIVASLHGRLHSPTTRPQRALAVEVGVDQLCVRWCNGRIEPASIWSEDQRCNGGKDPSRYKCLCWEILS